MLSARDVRYRLPDGRELFAEINLDLAPGSAAVVEGPSGTGKSTLLALLGGLITPTSGEVVQKSEREAPFAWVLQALNSLAARSTLANAALLATLDGELGAVVRARELLSQVGLENHANTRSRRLSGGELQRMAVAQVLTSSRPIILADEPTSQLDRENATRVMRLLIRSAEVDNRVVLIVTHDRDALPRGCRVLALTAHGLIERVATWR